MTSKVFGAIMLLWVGVWAIHAWQLYKFADREGQAVKDKARQHPLADQCVEEGNAPLLGVDGSVVCVKAGGIAWIRQGKSTWQQGTR